MAYQEAADGTESKQLAKITEKAKKDGQHVVLTYTRLDTTPQKEGQLAKTFISGIDPALDKAIRALKVGDECVIVKTKQGKYWNFTAIADKATFVAKAPYVPGQGTKSGGGGKPAYDQVGAKVGGVLHDAVALSVAKYGDKVGILHVADFARHLLTLSIQLEAETRADVFKDVAPAPSDVTSKATTKTEAIEEASIFEDDDSSDY